MVTLVLVALAGFAAQLVDGSLGMAFGVTATTGLLAAGMAPAVASASVHLAQIGTAAASGASHWRFGNVDWPVMLWLSLPGAAGGFLGATVLTNLSTEASEPWMATLLLLLGCYVIVRFALGTRPVVRSGFTVKNRRWLAPLGLVAGFLDATGGGGWGPISTSTLLSSGRLTPRRVIGSVDTGEIPVSVAASIGFLMSLGTSGLSWMVIGGLLVGGVIAAPFAAYLVRILPTRIIGVGAGGMIVLTNLQLILSAVGVEGVPLVAINAVLVALWIGTITWAVRRTLAERRTAAAAAETAQAERPAELDGTPEATRTGSDYEAVG